MNKVKTGITSISLACVLVVAGFALSGKTAQADTGSFQIAQQNNSQTNSQNNSQQNGNNSQRNGKKGNRNSNSNYNSNSNSMMNNQNANASPTPLR